MQNKYSIASLIKNMPNFFSSMHIYSDVKHDSTSFIFSLYEYLFHFLLEEIGNEKLNLIKNKLYYYRYLETRNSDDLYIHIRKKMFLFYLQNYSFHIPKNTQLFFKNNFDVDLAIRYELDLFSLQDIYLCEYSNISYRLYFFNREKNPKYSLEELYHIIKHFVPVYIRFYILPFFDGISNLMIEEKKEESINII